MAEGFEPYHVPQQSRRDKLRVNPQGGCVDNHNSHLLSCAPLLVPLYDPSFISPDLISCAANLHHRQSFDLDANTAGAGAGVKDEGMNLMGFAGGVNMISSSSAPTSHMLVDPQLSVQINPSTIQEINGNPFAYTQSNYIRPVLDQSFHGNEVVVYAREPNSNCSASAAAAEAASGQSLSLSLSSNNNSNIPLELNLQRCDSTAMFSGNSKLSGGYFVAGNGGSSSSTQLSRSSVPLGPFTGYASVLKGSRFLKPAHQLLEELCDVGRGIFPEKVDVDSSLLDPPLESLSGNGVDDESSLSCGDGGEQTRKKSRLLSMLDEVYKRYKQYYQQMQAVFASFESVAGLSSAAPFASLAIKALSKHFKCLKNAIMDQLHFVGKPHGKTNYEREEPQRSENLGRGGAYGQRSFHSSGFVDQPVWRPQRGLPERAVTVLRAWLFEHFLHPYPTDTDKLMLAKQTGLSRNQVSNWFINARVRLWKPMVEEIHMLETRQGQKASQRDDNLPTSCAIECENASSSFQRNGDFALKRSRNDLTETAPTRTEEQMNLPFNKLSQNPHLGVRMGNAGSSAGVSLTLGLHQNGMGLAESYPITAARRFGLDAHGDAFVVSGFATHDRQIGGHLFHDFQESNH